MKFAVSIVISSIHLEGGFFFFYVYRGSLVNFMGISNVLPPHTVFRIGSNLFHFPEMQFLIYSLRLEEQRQFQ